MKQIHPTHAEIAERNAIIRQFHAEGTHSAKMLAAIFRLSIGAVERIIRHQRKGSAPVA